MGLLAIVASQARTIGLLPRVVRTLPLLSLLCCILGISLLFRLPIKDVFRDTYLSENALLPHNAVTFFRESEWDVVRGLKLEMRDISHSPLRSQRVGELFTEYGLSAYTAGNTDYAISEASRGPHNEAVVIAAPWFVNDEFNEGGVALAVGLARSFQSWSFWHKNLVFVLPNCTQDLRTWVEEYHTSLTHTAGSIEGAIVMEYVSQSERFSSVDVVFEGLNGQLPNLDLINAVVQSTESEFSKVEVLGNTLNTYFGRLTAMGRHISQQASAGLVPAVGSAMFSGWRIDAVTLRAKFDEQTSYYDITTFGRVCESTARSINNLMEHFHQSFFFYLMLGPRYFVSIASFLPAGIAVASSFSIMSLYLFASYSAKGTFGINEIANGIVTQTAIIISSCLMGLNLGRATGLGVGSGVLLLSASLFYALRLSTASKYVLRASALAIAGLQLTALSMINFSLALVLGVLMAPLAWASISSKPVLKYMLVVLACPVIFGALLAHYYFHVTPTVLTSRLIQAHNELSVWTWMLIWGIWMPLWAAVAS